MIVEGFIEKCQREKRLAADDGIGRLTLAFEYVSGTSEVVYSVVNKNKSVNSGGKQRQFFFCCENMISVYITG